MNGLGKADSGGHPSPGVPRLDWGGTEEIRSLEAKVPEGGSCGGCGDLAANVDVGGREAKGFEDSGEALDDMENGFALMELDFDLLAPKSVAPRSSDCFSASASVVIPSPLVCGAPSRLCLLTSLIARIDPGFRIHCFFLHVKMCTLRSSLGKYSGRSPFSCSKRDIGLLQTLHLVKDAGGVRPGSIHVYRRCQRWLCKEER